MNTTGNRTEVGLAVVGSAVVGLAVVGLAVVGLAVVGLVVVGSAVVVLAAGKSSTVETSAVTLDCRLTRTTFDGSFTQKVLLDSTKVVLLKIND